MPPTVHTAAEIATVVQHEAKLRKNSKLCTFILSFATAKRGPVTPAWSSESMEKENSASTVLFCRCSV